MTWVSFRLSGSAPDLPPDALPSDAWTSVTNVHFRDGVAERSVGDYDVATTGTPKCRYDYIQGLNLDTGTGLVYAGLDIAGPVPRIGVYAVGVGHVDVTPAWGAGGNPTLNQWSGGPISGGVIVSSPARYPCWVGSSYGTATMLDGTLKFNACRPYKYMAVGISDLVTAGAKNTVRWTASAVPGSAPNVFTPAAGNDAGDVDITSVGKGANLIDGGQMGEDFVVYSGGSAHLLTYVGGATVMAMRTISHSVGVMALNCWADIGGAHLVLAQDDVVLMGQSGPIKSLVDGRLRRTIFENAYGGTGRSTFAQVWHDTQRSRVYVCVSGSASIDAVRRAYVYDIPGDIWGFRDLYDSATTVANVPTHAAMASIESQSAGFKPSRLVIGERGDGINLSSSQCYYVESDTAVTGLMAASELVKSDIDLGDASTRKLLRRVRVRGTSPTSQVISVQVAGKDSPDETYSYSSAQSFTLGTSEDVQFLVTGRWFSIKLTTAAPTGPLRILGFDCEYTAQGAY